MHTAKDSSHQHQISMTKGEILFYKSLAALVAVLTSMLIGIAGWQLNRTVFMLEQIAEINIKIEEIRSSDYAKMKYVESTDNIILKEIVSMGDKYEKLNNRVDYNRQCITELKVKFEEKHPK